MKRFLLNAILLIAGNPLNAATHKHVTAHITRYDTNTNSVIGKDFLQSKKLQPIVLTVSNHSEGTIFFGPSSFDTPLAPKRLIQSKLLWGIKDYIQATCFTCFKPGYWRKVGFVRGVAVPLAMAYIGSVLAGTVLVLGLADRRYGPNIMDIVLGGGTGTLVAAVPSWIIGHPLNAKLKNWSDKNEINEYILLDECRVEPGKSITKICLFSGIAVPSNLKLTVMKDGEPVEFDFEL